MRMGEVSYTSEGTKCDSPRTMLDLISVFQTPGNRRSTAAGSGPSSGTSMLHTGYTANSLDVKYDV